MVGEKNIPQDKEYIRGKTIILFLGYFEAGIWASAPILGLQLPLEPTSQTNKLEPEPDQVESREEKVRAEEAIEKEKVPLN